MLDPTALMCTPGLSHSRRRIGSRELVAVTTISAPLTASSTLSLRPHIRISLMGRTSGMDRSEEHTSELQSQSNLVCRLLLEKKKKKSNYTPNSTKRLTICPNRTTATSTNYQH